MMGLGLVGEGSGENSLPSVSNLSALAPPFTVDRLNLNPILSSNPVFNYSEMSFAVEPFSHTSQFASPSAPRRELDIHSTETSSLPLNDYQLSDSMNLGQPDIGWSDNAFTYGGGMKPYYVPSVPTMIGEGSSISEYGEHSSNVISPSGLSVPNQLDYTQRSFDLEYGPQWVNRARFSDGKRVNTVGLGGDFSSKNVNAAGSHGYKTQASQGILDIPYGHNSLEIPGAPYGNLNRFFDGEGHSGMFPGGNFETKPYIEQNVNVLPYDCTSTHMSIPHSTFPEPYPLDQSCETQQNVSNFQNSYGPQKCVLRVDPSFPSSVSVMRPSPAMVIHPPPAASDVLIKDVSSYRSAHSENVAIGDIDHSNLSKRKDSSLIPSSYINDDLFLPASVKGLTTSIQPKNTFAHKFEPRVGFQSQNINISRGFFMSHDSNQVVYPAVDSSDFVDHHNPAVDSPCWKGAPSFLFSAFDVGLGDSFKKNSDEFYRFDPKEHQNLSSFCDPARAFCEKVGEGNNNDDKGRGRSIMRSSESTENANSLSREQNIYDGGKMSVRTSMMTCDGVEISSQPSFLNESGGPSNSKSSSNVKLLETKHLNIEEDAGLILNDVSEGGSVAVCVAEKVLASPSSQEVSKESGKPLPDANLYVQILVKAMHNLSELLLWHVSPDACGAFEGKNMEIINSIIRNLNSCMRNDIDQETKKPKLNKFAQDTLGIIEESHCADKISGVSCMTNDSLNSHVQHDNKHVHEKKRDKYSVLSPLTDEVNKERNDDMTKAIKKILEENFCCDEESSSEALLFKSLWLETEAKLCSISYKARFDQMKIEMGKFESSGSKEMMPKLRSAPDSGRDSNPEACGGTSPNPAVKNSLISSTMGTPNDIEASIMARFQILKSREDNIKLINVEKEPQCKIVDGEHVRSIADVRSIVEGLNILKSRENDLRSTNKGKDQQPEMAIYDDLKSVLVRSNFLKAQDDVLASANREIEQHPEMVCGKHAECLMARVNVCKSRGSSSIADVKQEQLEMAKKNAASFNNDQAEAEAFNLSPKRHQTGILSEHEFKSHVGGGFKSLNELPLSVPDDPILSFNSRKMKQGCTGFHDSSLVSDWEHVEKDDI